MPRLKPYAPVPAISCHVELCGLPVVRQFVLSSDDTLVELHHAIQGTFGWENIHLHCFIEWEGEIPYFFEDKFDLESDDTRTLDEAACRLNLLESRLAHPGFTLEFQRKRSALFYEYDFGDRWICEIKLTGLAFIPERLGHCVHAQGVAPCENSGGVWGYQEKVEAARKGNREVRRWFREMGHAFNMEVTPERVQKQWNKYRKTILLES